MKTRVTRQAARVTRRVTRQDRKAARDGRRRRELGRVLRAVAARATVAAPNNLELVWHVYAGRDQ